MQRELFDEMAEKRELFDEMAVKNFCDNLELAMSWFCNLWSRNLGQMRAVDGSEPWIMPPLVSSETADLLVLRPIR